LWRKEENGEERDGSAELSGLRYDGNDFEGFLDCVLDGLGRILNNGPLARLGPVGLRQIRYAHSREEETERDYKRSEYLKAAMTEASIDHLGALTNRDPLFMSNI
jgi:hypothetical protein